MLDGKPVSESTLVVAETSSRGLEQPACQTRKMARGCAWLPDPTNLWRPLLSPSSKNNLSCRDDQDFLPCNGHESSTTALDPHDRHRHWGSFALGGIMGMGIRHETQAVNQRVNEISELRDPSPFRGAALLWAISEKCIWPSKGILRNPDPLLEKQVDESRAWDFEALLPDFVKQNPKLFPQAAADEIRRTFGSV